MPEQITLVVSLASEPVRYRLYPSRDTATAAIGEASQQSGVTLVLPLDGPVDLTFLVEAINSAENVLNDYRTAIAKGYLPETRKRVNAAADQLRHWQRLSDTPNARFALASSRSHNAVQ